MAPQQPITIIDPPAWERSKVTTLSLGLLVSEGQLAANVDGQPAEWIVPSERERVPNPPYSYIVSFVRFHEHGFAAPASRFLRACATTTAWSCKTSRRTRSRRRPRSSASANVSWGSQ
jgi:hypothetical protein